MRSVTSDTPLALNMSRSTSGIPSEFGANCDDNHSPIDSQVSNRMREMSDLKCKEWQESSNAAKVYCK